MLEKKNGCLVAVGDGSGSGNGNRCARLEVLWLAVGSCVGRGDGWWGKEAERYLSRRAGMMMA